jgi:polysaccharide export outer membrane protein
VQPGDVIRIQVFQEPDLDRELRVSQDGAVSLPLIGRVIAKDRTISQLEETVREAYDRDFLVNPQINLTILKYRVRSVNVLGMVNQPQSVECPPEQTMSVLDAISRAGGFNRLADRKRVRLTRTFPDGHNENYLINADELIGGTSKQTWTVQNDDVIFVPERVL